MHRFGNSGKSVQRNMAAVVIVSLSLAANVAAGPAAPGAHVGPGSAADTSRPGTQTALLLGAANTGAVVAPATVVANATPARVTALRSATFQVRYTGFGPAARAAFQRAVNIWAPLVTSSVPITVNASFAPLGPNVLGSAGPYAMWRNFAGAPQPNTWYPDAIANKRAGRQLAPAADIGARFNSGFTRWWFGVGPTPVDRIDFTAVVLHELGHGLGFFGAGSVREGLGTVRFATSPPAPMSYDRFTENGLGRALLTFPDRSAQLATQLRGNNVFFDSPAVRKANAGMPARLYAPPLWQPGSSYVHLNEATYRPGTRNSLMTPILNAGETIRVPGPITRAIFASIGW